MDDKTSVLKASAAILAVEKYGLDNQVVVAIEELSELQKELCKALRGNRNNDHIAEEIADVYIVLMQLVQMFECADKVEEWQIKKAKRLLVRVGMDE